MFQTILLEVDITKIACLKKVIKENIVMNNSPRVMSYEVCGCLEGVLGI
jgi:hypothetical protein